MCAPRAHVMQRFKVLTESTHHSRLVHKHEGAGGRWPSLSSGLRRRASTCHIRHDGGVLLRGGGCCCCCGCCCCMSRGIEGLIHEARTAIFPTPTRQQHAETADAEDCDTCRYTGTGLCSAAGVYLLVQRHRQTQHRPFLLGMAGGCFALGVARWFA